MSLELIHGMNLIITVHDGTILITSHQILLKVAPAHSLDLLVVVHITTVLEGELLSIPNNNLSCTGASCYLLAVLHPLYLV